MAASSESFEMFTLVAMVLMLSGWIMLIVEGHAKACSASLAAFPCVSRCGSRVHAAQITDNGLSLPVDGLEGPSEMLSVASLRPVG